MLFRSEHLIYRFLSGRRVGACREAHLSVPLYNFGEKRYEGDVVMALMLLERSRPINLRVRTKTITASALEAGLQVHRCLRNRSEYASNSLLDVLMSCGPEGITPETHFIVSLLCSAKYLPPASCQSCKSCTKESRSSPAQKTREICRSGWM